MNPGDPVEVFQVWAGGTRGVLTHWFDGYAFECEDGGNVLVRATQGHMRGCLTRWPRAYVRAIRPRTAQGASPGTHVTDA